MGGLTSALAPILQVGSALGGIAKLGKTFASNSIDNSALQAKNRLDEQQALQSAALTRQQRQLQLLQAETNRKQALRKAMAKQRATFGGQGLGLEDGSSEAVLLGLFDDSAITGALNRQAASLGDAASNLSLDQMQQKNLLTESSARERQNLNYLTDRF